MPISRSRAIDRSPFVKTQSGCSLFTIRYGMIRSMFRRSFTPNPTGFMAWQLLKEVGIWAGANGIAGALAGTALGALLSAGEYAPWMFAGMGVGLLGGAIGGAFLRLILEVLWQLLSLILRR